MKTFQVFFLSFGSVTRAVITCYEIYKSDFFDSGLHSSAQCHAVRLQNTIFEKENNNKKCFRCQIKNQVINNMDHTSTDRRVLSHPKMTHAYEKEKEMCVWKLECIYKDFPVFAIYFTRNFIQHALVWLMRMAVEVV